jgi:hypothetical protein
MRPDQKGPQSFRLLTKSSLLAGTFDSLVHASQTAAGTDRNRDGKSRWAVPKDHLLRKIEAAIDFSFIHDRVAGLYCPDNGRPPLDLAHQTNTEKAQ